MFKDKKKFLFVVNILIAWSIAFLIGTIPLFFIFYFHNFISKNEFYFVVPFFMDFIWIMFLFAYYFPSSTSGTDRDQAFFVLTLAVINIASIVIFINLYVNPDIFIHPELYIPKK